MSVTVETETVLLAGEIAHQVAQYENAWRNSDSQGMAEHGEQLELLCKGDGQAALIRGACTIAAASTRSTPCRTTRDTNTDHLQQAQQREHLMHEYVDGLQITTHNELAAA
jgi:hypothetical protein